MRVIDHPSVGDAGPASIAATGQRGGWRANLSLEFERRDGRSVLAARRHDGPLVVQKSLHPEGDGVCHAIIIHPPAGIAGGDQLSLSASVGAGAHALLATPGAGKWYRSSGARAGQRIAFDLAPDACLEWLPQETIVFNGALADMSTEVRLAAGARYVGWEILCLGRTGSGERFLRGDCTLRTRVTAVSAVGAERPMWLERGAIEGGEGGMVTSRAGLAGQPVCGTLVAAGRDPEPGLLAACREVSPAAGRGALTWLPGVLLARYLGPSTEPAKAYFAALWRLLRPAFAGRDAVDPRIWRT